MESTVNHRNIIDLYTLVATLPLKNASWLDGFSMFVFILYIVNNTVTICLCYLVYFYASFM